MFFRSILGLSCVFMSFSALAAVTMLHPTVDTLDRIQTEVSLAEPTAWEFEMLKYDSILADHQDVHALNESILMKLQDTNQVFENSGQLEIARKRGR